MEELENDELSPFGPTKWSYALPEERLSAETRNRRLKLYRAALDGDWEMAKRIYDDREEDILVEISRRGDTALHIATAAMHIDFVKELVKRMDGYDLDRRNEDGQTSLSIAAASGKVELAREFLKINRYTAMIPNIYGLLPIDMAASLGHKDMVKFLYQETGRFLSEEDLQKLFVILIETDLYDVALQLLNDYTDLATARNENGFTALHALARKHLMFSQLANQNQRGIFERCFNFGAKDVENKKLQAIELVERIWKRVILLSDSEISRIIAEPGKLIFEAAKRGNVVFLSILIRGYPDLIWKVENLENCYSIFHIAVMNRQREVFNLMYERAGLSKDAIIMYSKDQEGNNILHLAGKLAPPDRLNIVSGAALQMQQELLWFKEVENVVQPRFVEALNKDGLTPRELFAKEHENLRVMGEKWMKETAGSCMVVATLITGVAFAAAFTVPGGNNGATGFPVFLEKVSFKIFAISNAILLVSSSASILNFLSIYTSRFAEEDFRWWLPRKLQVGLVTLFISMAAMMVVFSATFFIFFNNGRLWIAILVTTIASTPVIMFIWQHSRLLCDVLRSTYVPDSVFPRRKNRLLLEKEEESDQLP